MIASKIQIKHFRTEAKLFAFVDDILKTNALYNIDLDDAWFVLSYWYGQQYRVLESHYEISLRLGTPHYGRDIRLHWDDILVLDGIALNSSWFYLPSLLIGKRERYITHARGYTQLGNVFNLVRVGVLQQIETPSIGWDFDPLIPR